MNLITRQEAANYLGDSSGGADDDLVAQLITHISRRLAEYCHRKDWGPQEARTEYHSGGSRFIVLEYAPLVSIASIYEDDADHEWGATTILDDEDYFGVTTTMDADNPGIIYSDVDVFLSGRENLKVTYTGGYAAEANIPDRLKTACLMQLEAENLRRGGGTMLGGEPIELLPEVQTLAERYRRLVHRI